MAPQNKSVAIAMSGGVDSSVAAALLIEQGYDVFGVMLRLWSAGPETSNRCCSQEDVALAEQVASQLDMPFRTLDVKDLFKQEIVDPFIEGYAQGETPNPCMRCNRIIRWGFLLESVLAMGASHLATGHYARIRPKGDRSHLFRAKDKNKDQTYVLSVLQQHQLARTIFPLGDITKSKVREQAVKLNLPVADRAESQDLCFVGDQDYRDFITDQGIQLSPPGPILDEKGKILGQHSGLANYTIGQRKGIGVSKSVPLYVLNKNMQDNVLVVGPKARLGRTSFNIGQANWISGSPPKSGNTLLVRVRYKAEEVDATLHTFDQAHAEIQLRKPVPDVTPGQYAVFYNGEECLGGGIILP
ncbi:MAG: tRNA 2-thiouridine(34) synthase MnmA [Chloroflexota bacterium]|nr:tRNA 2-thiouridine(34) synthase MnmA [Chloroflexota bacterium]